MRSRFAEQPEVIVPRSLRELLAEQVSGGTRRRRRSGRARRLVRRASRARRPLGSA
ncbi:hypothetical protein Arub01_28020 [Actinomadura rubrobrunea]|uniref:Uncharacterized protein n=1 Tax=Actinomadura rubrobrunea TaxID=115335 RepID=A0A9W6PX26_9ACTN|nr:hypothetical protein [Actinomadura rubrobrunea]GLW64558.1 hypothetical protein Arub01_28020 [Actinomadura rubrobrunea]